MIYSAPPRNRQPLSLNRLLTPSWWCATAMTTDRLWVYIPAIIQHVILLNVPFTDPGPTSSTVIQFLKTGNFPNATNQTFITVYPPGSQRDPIPDPYSVPVGPEAGDFFRWTTPKQWDWDWMIFIYSRIFYSNASIMSYNLFFDIHLQSYDRTRKACSYRNLH